MGNSYKYTCEHMFGNLQIHPRMPTHFEDAKGNTFLVRNNKDTRDQYVHRQ